MREIGLLSIKTSFIGVKLKVLKETVHLRKIRIFSLVLNRVLA